ncbi:uncharacterized protein LOC143249601 isoform X2 [Tachypleus tridentatus]|uniref:uncharacterized protein LOC143249601 isoform X2 n=1 Tax=Tachypleus tridentatus TaxID=6853 RepID=UPI003FD42851
MEWFESILMFLILSLPSLAQGQNCFGGIESYEKSTSIAFSSPVQSKTILERQDQSITKDCINLCKQEAQCLSFALDYDRFRCLSYSVSSIGRRDQLVDQPRTNFFEKICIRGVDKSTYDRLCGSQLWIFERVKGAYLDGFVDRNIPNIQNKEECEKLCLIESSFTCRSADYDEIERVCRMSREDRRTQPQAFRQVPGSNRDYFENLCTSSTPITCKYEQRPERTVVSMDFLQFGNTAEDCERKCTEEATFNCRAYTFLANKCYLSGDDVISLGGIELPVKQSAIYGEKQCVVDKCTGGIFTFEKVTGYVLRSAITQTIPLSNPGALGNTLQCKEFCQNAGLDCPAFTVNYRNMRCDQLDRNSQGRTRELAPRTAENYFERLCLRGQVAMKCQDKAWAFERVLGYEMSADLYKKSIPLIQSRRDCEEACLDEVTFTCRSALYDEESTVCKLSQEDRRTRPTDYKANNNININYLENQCTTASPCPYEEKSNAFPTYTDVVQTSGITTQESCEQACTTYSTFNCRSYAFYSSSGQCFLSGDDTASGGQEAAQGRSGINYFERKCQAGQILPTPGSTYTPFPPTSIFTPPPGQKCQSNEQLVYEKVTGHELVGVAGNQLYQGSASSPGITYECLQRCRITTDCQAFILDYQTQQCTSLRDGSTNRAFDLRPALGKSYFEGICMPNFPVCGKLWVYERLVDQEFRGPLPRDTVQLVRTRQECETRCFQESRFRCVAANYYNSRQECVLFTESRDSRNGRMVPARGVEFLENQCNLDISRCSYKTVERDQFMLYTTKSVPSASSTFQCEQECNQEREFACRSYTYVEQSGFVGGNQCLLSSESRETNQERALRFRSRALYTEKNCKIDSGTVLPTLPTLPPFTSYSPLPPFTSYSPLPPLPFPQERCLLDQYTYEKTTGYDLLVGRREFIRVRGAVGIIGECQNACQRLGDRCRAFVIQYGEYQRCFWLDNAAGDNSDALTSSPLMTYFEKICLKDRPCEKLWTFERLPGYELQESPEREIPNVNRRKDCEDFCLNERQFLCRSATYFYQSRNCRLFSETRRTRPKSFLRATGVADYLENQCAPEPSTCQYRDFLDRFFPKIDRLLRTFSLPECQIRCDEERGFTCRAVNFETITRDCALCSDDSTALEDGQNNLQFRRNSVFSEKGTCEQVSVQCTEQDMLLTLNFQSPFNGRVYAKGNPTQCFVVGQGQSTLQFAISLGSRCGTRKEESKVYANEVVVQQHPIIVMDTDKTIRVVCSFETGERTITMDVFGRNGEKGMEVTTRRPSISSIVTNTAPPPNVAMRILDPSGRDAHVVGLGDELELRIDLTDPSTAFAIFARNLYARSSNGESLFLLDSNGCPTDPTIFPALQLNMRDQKSLIGNFKAFRFPSTGRVNFEVQIRFCQDRCDPVRCANNVQSYGRRKRDAMDPMLETESASSNGSAVDSSDVSSHVPHPEFRPNEYPVMVPQSAVIETTEQKLEPRDFLNGNETTTMSSRLILHATNPSTLNPPSLLSNKNHVNYTIMKYETPSDYPQNDSTLNSHYNRSIYPQGQSTYNNTYEQDSRSNKNGIRSDLSQNESTYQNLSNKDDNRSGYSQNEPTYDSAYRQQYEQSSLSNKGDNRFSYSQTQSAYDNMYRQQHGQANLSKKGDNHSGYSHSESAYDSAYGQQYGQGSPSSYSQSASAYDSSYGREYREDSLSNKGGNQPSYSQSKSTYDNTAGQQHVQDHLYYNDNNHPDYPHSESTNHNAHGHQYGQESVPQDNDRHSDYIQREFSNSRPHISPYGINAGELQDHKLERQQDPRPDQEIHSEYRDNSKWNDYPYGKNHPYPNSNDMSANWNDVDQFGVGQGLQRDSPQFQNGSPTKDIVATTQKPVPQEVPLSLAIMVGEDPEPQEPWSHTRYAEPFEKESNMVCTSQSTIIATAVTLSLLHIGLLFGGYFYYRWRRKNKRKRQMDDQLPFPVPNTTSPPQVVHGSADVMFRSIYEGYDASP